MTNLIPLFIYGALSFAPGLQRAIDTRTTMVTAYSLDPAIISDYSCYIGLPYGYAHYIGREVHFLTDSGLLLGPWLAVDVESDTDAGTMKNRGLAADVHCPMYPQRWVHTKGEVVIKSSLQ